MSVQKIDINKFTAAINGGLEKGGWGVKNRMVSSAARDTGNLRSLISSEASEGLVTIKSEAEYSSALEFGTGIFNTNGDGRQTPWVYSPDGGGTYFTTSGQQAQPFFFDNFEQGKITIPAQIKSALRNEFS